MASASLGLPGTTTCAAVAGHPCFSKRRLPFPRTSGKAGPWHLPPSRRLHRLPLYRTIASASTELSADQTRGPKEIEVEFVTPDPSTSSGETVRVVVESGTRKLRNVMLEARVDLYDLYGKVMNCGGGGNCGTCIVEILEGSDILNERTFAEQRLLKKRPETWRLSCQTILGDSDNHGKVTVQQLPQKKKS